MDNKTDPNFRAARVHASFTSGGSRFITSDGCGEKAGFSGFSISLNTPGEAAARHAFAALAEGGKVGMPLGKTFWSPCFGTVTDRFGVCWMVNVEP